MKDGNVSQTTYAGITRIRFKGTPHGADLSLSAPLYSSQLFSIAARGQTSSRAARLGEFIAEHSATVRAAARAFGCSKSTVHKDVSARLRKVDPALFRRVQAVLARNKAERHLRGGAATRRKYSKK